ncbi:hypothetical protein M0805_002259 [Coniferiporia weirii]|nr:hypothetical protein M0805_002259 [Coniferiporia weirii]
MEKCSVEVVTSILECACAGDLGSTARSLGLASKYFRAIAEPVEFRALVIAGPDQLDATRARIEKARSVGTEVKIKHLFICDLETERALMMDTYREPSPENDESDESDKETGHSTECYSQLWERACALIQSARETLTTITALQQIPSREMSSLHTLSGIHLPRLKTLTLKHTYYVEDNSFISLTAPLLQSLNLIAPPSTWKRTRNIQAALPFRLHPLLANMHSRFGALTNLVIRGGDVGVKDADMLVRVLCGSTDGLVESVSKCMSSRRLPGRLVSAAVIMGREPNIRCGRVRSLYRRRVHNFVKGVEALDLDGLGVCPPTPTCAEIGKREYEVLLAE